MTEEFELPEIAQLREALEAHDKGIKALEGKAEKVRTKLEPHENEVAHQSEKMGTLDAEAARLRITIAKAKAEAESNEPDDLPVQTRIDIARLETIQEEHPEAERQHDASAEKVKDLLAELTDIQGELAEAEAGVTGLIAQLFRHYDVLDLEITRALQKNFAVSQEGAGPQGFSQIGGLELISREAEQPTLGQITGVRLDSVELEYRIRALLEHLTARRIAEEMDTPTYLFRLEEFFARAGTRAHDLLAGPILRLGYGIAQKKDEVETLRQLIAQALLHETSQTMQGWVQEWTHKNAQRADQMIAQLTAIEGARADVVRRLEAFTGELLSEDNAMRTKQTATFVSEYIENSKFARAWPLFAAIIATAMVKIALSLQSSMLVAQYDFYLLSGTFLAVFLFSAKYGRTFRKSVMEKLFDRYRDGAKVIFAPKLEKHQQFKISEIPLSGEELQKIKPVEDTDTMEANPKALMILKNALLVPSPALAIVAAIAAAEGTFSLWDRSGQWQSYVFVGTSSNGYPCRIVEGNLTHKDTGHYYVLQRPAKSLSYVQSIFPEFYSMAVPAQSVTMIVEGQAAKVADDGAKEKPQDASPAGAQETAAEIAEGQASKGAGDNAEADARDPSRDAWTDCAAEVAQAPQETDEAASELAQIKAKLGELIAGGQGGGEGLSPAEAQVLINAALAQQSEATKPLDLSELVSTLDAGFAKVAKDRVDFTSVVMPAAAPVVADANPAETHIWNYHLSVEDKVFLHAPNTQVLFLFPPGVRGTDNTSQGAFARGLSSFETPTEDSDVHDAILKAQLLQLAKSLSNWLEGNTGDMSITVKGFASLKWEAEADLVKREDLNFALAEGRRQAVLHALEDALGEEKSNRIWVRSEGATPCALLSGARLKIWEGVKDRGFEKAEDMVGARAKFLGVAGFPDDDPLVEFTRRSVVVEAKHGKALCEETEQVAAEQ